MNHVENKRIIQELADNPEQVKRFTQSRKFVNRITKDPNRPPPSPILMGALAAAGMIMTLLIVTR